MEVSCGPDCKVKRKDGGEFKLKLKGRSNETKVISFTVSAPDFRPSVYLVSTSGALQPAPGAECAPHYPGQGMVRVERAHGTRHRAFPLCSTALRHEPSLSMSVRVIQLTRSQWIPPLCAPAYPCVPLCTPVHPCVPLCGHVCTCICMPGIPW